MWGAGFHGVRVGSIVGVGRESDAAGIDDERSVGQVDSAGDVRVAAEDQVGINPGANGDGFGACLVHAVRPDVMEEVGEVIVRGAVAEEDGGGEPERGGQSGEPFAMAGRDGCVGEAVGGSHGIAMEREQLAFVIAANGGQAEGFEEVGGFGGPEGAGEEVAEIDDRVNAAVGDVGENGFEGGQIAMDVGDGGEAHRLIVA